MKTSMSVRSAVQWAGSVGKLASRIGVTSSAVSHWESRNDGLVPDLRAYQIHALSRGKVKLNSAGRRQ